MYLDSNLNYFNTQHKKVTTDQNKISLVERLVKEGHITYADSLMMLEVEVDIQYVTINAGDVTYTQPFQVTCDTTPAYTSGFPATTSFKTGTGTL